MVFLKKLSLDSTMDSIQEKLNRFDDTKLIDIVKNYRQYGYDTELRKSAIDILLDRGVDVEELKQFGHFDNKVYDEAEKLYKAFEKQSDWAFIFCLSFYFLIYGMFLTLDSSDWVRYIVAFAFFSSIIGFVVMFIKSFISQSKYYKLLGKKDRPISLESFFVLGLILYFVMYFVFKRQMKEEMELIR